MYDFFASPIREKTGLLEKKINCYINILAELRYFKATLIRNNYETHLEQMGQVQTRKALTLPSEKTIQSGRKRIPRKNRQVSTVHS